MSKIITNEIIRTYLDCPYKTYLKVMDKYGQESKYSQFEYEMAKLYQEKAETHLEEKCSLKKMGKNIILSNQNLTFNLAFKVTAVHENYTLVIDALIKEDSNNRQYTPVVFIYRNKINMDDKIFLGMIYVIMLKLNLNCSKYGRIIHGDNYTNVKVHITEKLLSQSQKNLNSIVDLTESKKAPPICLNKHCSICEYNEFCRKIAVEKDDLSLIRNLSYKEIKKLKRKGIFTTTQLSYKFNPKMVSRKNFKYKPKHFHSLKALALREDKVYIVDGFDIPERKIKIFIDIEGIPDRDFDYLIGMVICANGSVHHEYLWADTEADEKHNWFRFLNIVFSHENFSLFHYGSYDSKFIEKMCKKYNTEPNLVKMLKDNTINILTLIYNFIYFPTYENDLKSIAKYLGFERKSSVTSGLQSVIERINWEKTYDVSFKENIIAYNHEDCMSLKLITDTLKSLNRNDENDSSAFVYTDNIPKEYPHMFKKIDFFYDEFEKINNSAYFDYQRSKIFIRTNSSVKKIVKKEAQKKSPKESLRKLKINQEISCQRPYRCIYCGRGIPYRNVEFSRIIYDLKIVNGGIKRWVIRYKSGYYRCKHRRCKKVFVAPSFLNTVPRKFGRKLCGYILYLSIYQNMTLRAISNQLNDLFGYEISHGSILLIKKNASKYYLETYNNILNNLLNGKLIHADETTIRTKNGKGYVWVFTNLEEVYYIFTETREGEKTKQLLADFKGVLVSDFYAVYDSIDSPQQKCHIHLIRDLNDEIKKNPFDEELISLAKGYKELLMPIIETIDKYGLKKYHLNKHNKFVDRFYRDYIDCKYSSPHAISFKNRFDKNRNKLFTFLKYDGIPWNNNNAEHAVKPVVKHRKCLSGLTTANAMNEYLVLLSVCQTLRLRDINIFDFFMSGRLNLEK